MFTSFVPHLSGITVLCCLMYNILKCIFHTYFCCIFIASGRRAKHSPCFFLVRSRYLILRTFLFSPSENKSVQFSQSCPTLCNPIDCSKPGFPVHHQLPELAQTHVHWFGNAIQPSHPLSSTSPPVFNLSQHQDYSSESVLHIRWPTYWHFSFFFFFSFFGTLFFKKNIYL